MYIYILVHCTVYSTHIWARSALYTILYPFTPQLPVRQAILSPNLQRRNFAVASVFMHILCATYFTFLSSLVFEKVTLFPDEWLTAGLTLMQAGMLGLLCKNTWKYPKKGELGCLSLYKVHYSIWLYSSLMNNLPLDNCVMQAGMLGLLGGGEQVPYILHLGEREMVADTVLDQLWAQNRIK